MKRSSLITLGLTLTLAGVSTQLSPQELSLSVRAGIVFLLASLGGLLGDKPQRIDFSLEGKLLAGAIAALFTHAATGSPWLGMTVGGLAGAASGGFFQALATRLSPNRPLFTCLILGAASANALFLLTQAVWPSIAGGVLAGAIFRALPRLTARLTAFRTPLMGMTCSLTFLTLLLSDPVDAALAASQAAEAVALTPLSLPLPAHLPLVGALFSQDAVVYAALLLTGASAWRVWRRQSRHLPDAVLNPVEPGSPAGETTEPATESIPHTHPLTRIPWLDGLLAGCAGAYAVLGLAGGEVAVPCGMGWVAAFLIPFAAARPWKGLVCALLAGVVWVVFSPYMTYALLVPVLAAAVQAGTPILYATVGEIITERTGVLNLGVEGMMMVGAFAGFMGLLLTGSPWFGFILAGFASALMGALHGTVCLVFRGSQVVSGLALTIFGAGLADYLGTPYIGRITDGFTPFALPGLSTLPLTGSVFFRQDVLVYLSYLLIPLCWFFLMRTRWGLAMRAAGENPAAVAAAGLSPQRLRWAGLLVGGFLVGLGGAYLSLAYTHMWTHTITAGRGWIAVALVIFAFWRPGRATVGAYLFGGVWVFQLRLQASGTVLPSDLLAMFPYLLTLLVLVVSSVRGRGRSSPAALGVNLEPGD